MPAETPYDLDLMRRYDGHGPRYTSYPTALQFTPDFDVAAYRRAAFLSNEAPARPLSLYVHVPFCASPCFYCGCTRIITRDPQAGANYLGRLQTEIALQAALFDGRRTVRQLHLGGGTPTFLSMPQLGTLLGDLRRRFRLDTSLQREFSIEIDPRTVTPGMFEQLADLGFNRVSLGVQDFEPRVQRAVNRRQSVAQVEQSLAAARAANFRSVSFDLIYGLPQQTLASFERTLDRVLALRPDRIAVYGYAHLPQVFKAQRALEAAHLPGTEARLRLAALTVNRLCAAGYRHIGMDHFALPDDELCTALARGELTRNFQGYSTHASCDLVGLGVSSIGAVGNAYAQNAKTLPAYYAAIDAGRLAIERGLCLTTDDQLRRDVIQRIMCAGSVDFREVGARHAIDFASYFGAELLRLRRFVGDGLVTVDDRRLVVSAPGRLLLRQIAMVFDAHLRDTHHARSRFSKVI